MSQVGGEVGGKLASSQNPQQTQFPYFTSPGGVTPQQTSLANYDYGQNLLEGAGQFEGGDEGGGNSLSTMASQVFGGANMGKALNLASMSDTNQNAEFSAFTNAENIAQQNNSAALAEQQQTQANVLGDAKTAGSAAGLKDSLAAPLPGAGQ